MLAGPLVAADAQTRVGLMQWSFRKQSLFNYGTGGASREFRSSTCEVPLQFRRVASVANKVLVGRFQNSYRTRGTITDMSEKLQNVIGNYFPDHKSAG